MKCLVTGGAGFIGSHLTEYLLSQGHEVRVVDSLLTGKRENLDAVIDQIEFVEADLDDPQVLTRAVSGRDVIFHLAAIPSVALSVEEPIRCHGVNTVLTLRLLEEARAAQVGRVVFASSSAVYGNCEHLPIAESERTEVLSPYAAQKLASEEYLRIYSSLHGLDTVALRYFNVFGPRQDPSSPYSGVISIFLSRFEDGVAPTIDGDGGQTRDFIFVGDVVRAVALAAEAPLENRHLTVNIAGGQRISIADLATTLRDLTGGPDPKHGEPRAGDVRDSLAEVRKAQKSLGFEAQVSLEDGLAQTLAWYRNQGNLHTQEVKSP